MAVKKRERALSPEEFIEKQKADYGPFWFHSEVLFGAQLYPVSDSFKTRITILFLLDVSDFSTDSVALQMQRWEHRYAKLPWQAVLTFQQKYVFLKNPKFFEQFKNQPVFLDPFGEIFERFGSANEPVAVIFKNGQFVSSMPLLPNIHEAFYNLETEFQKQLRIDDVGLPLPIVEKMNSNRFPLQLNSLSPSQVSRSGEWGGSDTILMTEQNGAVLTTPFKGRLLRLVAIAHPDAKDSVKVSITLNEKALTHTQHNQLIHVDSTGTCVFEVNKIGGIYDLIQSEQELSGTVKLTIQNAQQNGFVFYALKTAS